MNTQRLRFFVCAIFMGVSITGISNAQNESWLLDISGGHAKINGVVVSPESLPESLDLNGPSIHLEVLAFGKPIIAIGDAVYALEKDRIRDATPEEIDKYGVVAVFSLSDDDARTVVFNSLREIQRNAAMVPSAQVQENVRGNAMRASQMVAALPHLEMQSYWNDVRQNDDALYKSLLREREVEIEVAGLVDMIRKLPDGEPRKKAIRDLKEQLSSLFDMKQENRKREVSELEQQLETLTKRMKKREEMREAIVDQRMKELLGSY